VRDRLADAAEAAVNEDDFWFTLIMTVGVVLGCVLLIVITAALLATMGLAL
jgi:hypothetical protein